MTLQIPPVFGYDDALDQFSKTRRPFGLVGNAHRRPEIVFRNDEAA